MRKQLIIIISLILLTSGTAFTVTTNDPNDRIYDFITSWEAKGYIEKLPTLRPYPTQLIVRILKDVKNNGSPEDRKTAEEYLEELDSFSLHAASETAHRFAGDDYYGETGANVKIEAAPSEKISLSGDINLLLVDQQTTDAMPSYIRTARDLLPDWSDVDLFGKNYLVRQGINTSAAVGTDSMYFQTGLIRSSFGPFFDDGAVLSPEAPQSGHFSFTWMHEAFNFTSALLALTATTETGEGRYPEKYLVIHSAEFFLFSWLELNVFETVVYGGRLEPLYLIPFSEFFYLQGLNGFRDNSLLGFSTSIDLPYNIDFDFLFYADDLHFNDMIRLDFDTKYKLSFQTGLSWTPEAQQINRLSLDYLLVTPYMYSHITESDTVDNINYQNYTNLGENMGPSLDPNSDRISLKLLLQPVKNLDLELTGRFIRHGNGSVDGSENVGDGDGTIFDDGFDDSGVCTFQDTTRFMVQDIIEKTLQAGFNAEMFYDVFDFRLSGNAGYTSEWVWNSDLVAGFEWNNYFEIGFGLSY